jgi:hypothetical protein
VGLELPNADVMVTDNHPERPTGLQLGDSRHPWYTYIGVTEQAPIRMYTLLMAILMLIMTLRMSSGMSLGSTTTKGGQIRIP